MYQISILHTQSSVHLLPLVPMRLLVTLILGLYLLSDQCRGFAEEGLRELCRKTNPCKKNCPSMDPTESGTFSCGRCEPSTMKEPYLCDYCYRGKEEKEQFHCKSCKLGLSKSKLAICDQCNTNFVEDNMSENENAELLHTDGHYKYFKVLIGQGTRMISGKVIEICEAAGMKAACRRAEVQLQTRADKCSTAPLLSM